MNDIVGKIYNRLTVVKSVIYTTKISKKQEVRWLCKCACGKEVITTSSRLKSGETKSCGCYRADNMRKNSKLAQIANTKYHPSETSARSVFRSGYCDSDLEFKDFFELSQKNCFYCNSPPNNKYKMISKNSSEYYKENCLFTYNGLDRVNNLLPHSKNNVVPCCAVCNSAKSNMSLSDFISWITKLCEFNQ